MRVSHFIKSHFGNPLRRLYSAELEGASGQCVVWADLWSTPLVKSRYVLHIELASLFDRHVTPLQRTFALVKTSSSFMLLPADNREISYWGANTNIGDSVGSLLSSLTLRSKRLTSTYCSTECLLASNMICNTLFPAKNPCVGLIIQGISKASERLRSNSAASLLARLRN